MDVATLFNWITMGAAVLAALLSIWNFLQSPTRQLAAELAKLAADFDRKVAGVRDDMRLLDSQHDDTKSRVAAVEHTLQHLPDVKSFNRLEVSIAQLSGRIDTLNVRLDPVEILSRRVQDVLMEQSK